MSSWFRTYGFGEILDRFLIGAYPTDADDVRMLAWMGVRRVVNLTEDREYEDGDRARVEAALRDAGIDEHRVRLTDHGALPREQLDEAVTTVGRWLDDGEIVYLHCRAGWQRSAAVAAGVVATRREVGVEEALRFVKQRKASAEPLAHQRANLHDWWQAREQRASSD